MCGGSGILGLPLEILELISSYLDYSQLCQLMMVLRGAREDWEDPSLWSHFKLTPRNDVDLKRVFCTKRFSSMKRMRIRVLNKDCLDVIKSNTSLKHLEVLSIDDDVDEDELENMFLRLESLELPEFGQESSNLNESGITEGQIRALFNRMSQKNGMRKSLKRLTLNTVPHLDHIDSSVVAECLLHLQELELNGNNLNEEHTTVLFNHSAVGSNLKKLTVSGTWILDHIEPAVFANFFSKIDKVKICLDPGFIEYEQLQELLRLIGDDQETILKDLYISEYEPLNSDKCALIQTMGPMNVKGLILAGWLDWLEQIDCNVMVECFLKSDELEFDGSSLSREQTTAIFNQRAAINNLKKLTVSGSWILDHIEPSVFANFLSKIEKVKICLLPGFYRNCLLLQELLTTIVKDEDTILNDLDVHTDLIRNNQKCELIQTRALKSGQNLKRLTLTGLHDLAHIDCNVVAERFLKLDELEFDGNLTSEQTTALFNQSEVRNNLKKLTVHRKWHLEHIKPSLFAKFFSKIENVTVPFILFEKEQLEELFKTIVDDQDQVSRSRLDIVNFNILARGINNLEEVRMRNIGMTNFLLEKIYKEMLVKTTLKMLDVRGNFPRVRNCVTGKCTGKYAGIQHKPMSRKAKKKYGNQTEFLCSRLLEKIKNKISVFFYTENEKDGEEFYDSDKERVTVKMKGRMQRVLSVMMKKTKLN
jgi:hypothetical protein